MTEPGVPLMVEAGRGLVTAAAGRGVAVRLLGGVAIWIRSSEEARAALGRAYPDVDLAANQRQSRDLRAVLEEQGLEEETLVLESAPKTIAWRMRARVGRRVRWYEVPEEVVR